MRGLPSQWRKSEDDSCWLRAQMGADKTASRFGRATCDIKARCHANRSVTLTLNVRVKSFTFRWYFDLWMTKYISRGFEISVCTEDCLQQTEISQEHEEIFIFFRKQIENDIRNLSDCRNLYSSVRNIFANYICVIKKDDS